MAGMSSGPDHAAHETETAPPLAGTTYPLHEHTLANGLRVIASPDHGSPSVAVNLWYRVGSRHERAGLTGFAHLFEHIMFQGSAHVASGEHFGLLQAAGASLNATTWFDRTNYFESLPIGGLDLALWLEADRMGTLLDALTEENFDTQREVVKEEKRQRYDNVPYGDVMERLGALTFPADHPYGHTTIGSMADLDAASVDDARAFFATHYVPGNAVLTIVGDLEPDEAFAKADEYFGPLPAGAVPPDELAAPLPPLTGLPHDEAYADVPAEAVYFTWRLPSLDKPAFDAAELALSILGGGQTSRLHRELVRRTELAQGAGSAALGLIGGNSLGFATARARDGVSTDRLTEALVTEIDRFAEEGPTDLELRRAKAQFERGWLQSMARLDSRADQIGQFATLLGSPSRINTALAEVNAITADQVRRAAADHLRSDQRATLTYHRSGDTGSGTGDSDGGSTEQEDA